MTLIFLGENCVAKFLRLKGPKMALKVQFERYLAIFQKMNYSLGMRYNSIFLEILSFPNKITESSTNIQENMFLGVKSTPLSNRFLVLWAD